jgi:hypothetical protein
MRSKHSLTASGTGQVSVASDDRSLCGHSEGCETTMLLPPNSTSRTTQGGRLGPGYIVVAASRGQCSCAAQLRPWSLLSMHLWARGRTRIGVAWAAFISFKRSMAPCWGGRTAYVLRGRSAMRTVCSLQLRPSSTMEIFCACRRSLPGPFP